MYSPTGTIKSPNYPRYYPPDQSCEWVVHAQQGKQVELIVKSFELEGSHSSGCAYDYLEIRNGGSNSSPLIGTYCGTDILPRFKSFGNMMYLKLFADASREMKGFEIDYDSRMSGCGGVIQNTMSGTITSPNYP